MNRDDESPEMHRHRLRNEERTRERNCFIVSIAYGIIGAAAFTAVLYWLVNYTHILTNLIEKAAP